MIAESKGIGGILILAALAVAGGISKALVKVLEANDSDELKFKKFTIILSIYITIAMPFGVIIGGWLFDEYASEWLAYGGAFIGGAISSNVIVWITGDGFATITKAITRRFK